MTGGASSTTTPSVGLDTTVPATTSNSSCEGACTPIRSHLIVSAAYVVMPNSSNSCLSVILRRLSRSASLSFGRFFFFAFVGFITLLSTQEHCACAVLRKYLRLPSFSLNRVQDVGNVVLEFCRLCHEIDCTFVEL